MNQANWYLAKNDPPVYFPKGVPADCPTGHHDGVWITTGDARNTRFFIPAQHDKANALAAEALAGVNPDYARKRDREMNEPEKLDLKKLISGSAQALGMGILEVDRHIYHTTGHSSMAPPVHR